LTGRRIYASRTECSFVVLLKSERQKYEHTIPDIGHENAESGRVEKWRLRDKSFSSGEELTRARTRWRRAPADAVDWPWKGVQVRRAQREASLLDLFDGRRQLIVYRAFFEPGVKGWPEHACIGCSMVADQVAHPAHLNARDTTLGVRLTSAAEGHRALESADGLEAHSLYTLTDDFDKDFG